MPLTCGLAYKINEWKKNKNKFNTKIKPQLILSLFIKSEDVLKILDCVWNVSELEAFLYNDADFYSLIES